MIRFFEFGFDFFTRHDKMFGLATRLARQIKPQNVRSMATTTNKYDPPVVPDILIGLALSITVGGLWYMVRNIPFASPVFSLRF